MWISNSAEAGVFLVMANAAPEVLRPYQEDVRTLDFSIGQQYARSVEHASAKWPWGRSLTRQLGYKGITCFVIPAGAEGLTVGKKEDKLGQRASDTAQIFFEDVKVPKANLLAPEGQGFKLAMETFNQTRPDIGGMAAGLMRRALDECVAYAKERQAFGVPIAQHQMVQAMLAEMAIRAEATELLYRKAAWNLDNGVRNPVVSSLAKAYGADAAMQTAVDAVQVFGGNGYVKEYPVEKLMRDAKVLQIYEGTSQIQRLVIAKNLLS